MTEPFDLNAVIAEAAGEPFTFKLGDETYELPASPDMQLLAILAGGKLDEMLPALFGAAQYARFVESGAKLPAAAFDALLSKYMEHAGVDVGEASGSSR